MTNMIEAFRRWGIAFILGGLFGMILQSAFFLYNVEVDCKHMKSFRHQHLVYDCSERKV